MRRKVGGEAKTEEKRRSRRECQGRKLKDEGGGEKITIGGPDEPSTGHKTGEGSGKQKEEGYALKGQT